VTTIGLLLGKQWKALTEEQKKPYFDKAKEDKVRAQQEKEEYRKKDTSPRPPLTPFLAFMKDQRQINGTTKFDSIDSARKAMVSFGAQWQKLDDQTKSRYLKKYEEERAKFEQALDSWMKKQIGQLTKASEQTEVLTAYENLPRKLKNATEARVLMSMALSKLKHKEI